MQTGFFYLCNNKTIATGAYDADRAGAHVHALQPYACVRGYARLLDLRMHDGDRDAGRYDNEHANAGQHREYGNMSVRF